MLGDSVNVAARLEGLADPGGICLSGEVHDQIQGKLSLGFRAMGSRRLKSIGRPIRAYNIEGSRVESNKKLQVVPRLALAGSILAIVCVGLFHAFDLGTEPTQFSAGSPPWSASSELKAPPLPSMSDVVASSEWNGHAYYAILTWGSSWQSAVADAEKRGGYLVSISSDTENDVVFDLVKSDERLWDMYKDGQAFGPWIGIYQDGGAKEPGGGWALVSGEPLTYVNWADGQPNNFGGNSDVARLHNYIHQPSPFWDDAPVDGSSRGYILEIDNTDSLQQEN